LANGSALVQNSKIAESIAASYLWFSLCKYSATDFHSLREGWGLVVGLET